jgi:hypothetical protein
MGCNLVDNEKKKARNCSMKLQAREEESVDQGETLTDCPVLVGRCNGLRPVPNWTTKATTG